MSDNTFEYISAFLVVALVMGWIPRIFDFIVGVLSAIFGAFARTPEGASQKDSKVEAFQQLERRPPELQRWSSHLTQLCHVDGPTVGFDYGGAKKAGSPERRTIRMEAIWKDKSGKLYIEGFCFTRKEGRHFRTDRIKSKIHWDGMDYELRDFLSRFTPELKPAQKPAVKKATAAAPKLPAIDTKSERAKYLSKQLEDVDWREIGVLSMSGYRVGSSAGRKEAVRRGILANVLLHDDLADVSDRGYAAEWGVPGSQKRYTKIENSIKGFAGRAKARKDRRRMSRAIREWESDLRYLKQLQKSPFFSPKK